MTNLVDRFSEALKIVVGRKLTLKQMTEAVAAEEYIPSPSLNSSQLVKDWRSFFLIVRRNSSNNEVSVFTEYDQNGSVYGRQVREYIPNGGPVISYKETVYDPAGRFIGKTIADWRAKK